MNDRIRETGRYGVSILANDQEPLSLHFAGAAHEPDLVGSPGGRACHSSTAHWCTCRAR